MAEFNPRFKQSNDPSYIGYSKETSGSTAVSGLIKGISGTAITGINTIDEINTENIKAEIAGASVGTGGAPSPAAPVADPLAGTEEPVDGAIDVFGEEKNSATVPEIAQGTARGQKLTQAYKQGKISPTAYWGQMAALSKSLKARYAGYSEVIDRQFQGVTGQVPANALAETQRKELLKNAASASSEEKQFNSFIKSNIQYLPADYFDRIKAGKPYSQLETYSAVHKTRSTEHNLNYEKDKLALAHASGNLVEEEAIGQAQNTLNTRADSILSAVATAPLIDAIQQAQAKGATVSPQEKEQIRVSFGQLKLKIEDTLESELRKPTSDGKQTFYSLIRDPGKVKAIKEQALARVNYYQQLIEDNNFGLLGATLNNAKAIQDDATNKLLSSDPYFSLQDAATKNGGGPLLNEHFADQSLVTTKNRAGKAVMDLMMAQIAAGKPKPMVDALKEIMAQPISAEDKKAQARGAIQTNITAMISPNATSTSAATAAENLYGKGNANFLAHFPASQQTEMYTKLVSEPVTDKMLNLRSSRPDVWNGYVNWAKGSFLALQRSNAATIQEGVANRENVNVTWDPTTNQFSTELTEAGKADQRRKAGGTDSLISGFERAFAEDTDSAVTAMNKQIKVLEKVLKANGGNVSQEIANLLGTLDIKMMTPKQQTFFQRARQAIDTELNPPETGTK